MVKKTGGLLILLVITAIALYLRKESINYNIPLLTDQSHYAGAARDFVDNGEFSESVTNKLLPRFMPIGYPFLMAKVHQLTGLPFQTAGKIVSLLFGSLICLIGGLMVWRAFASLSLGVLTAILLAGNWPLVKISTEVMTDPVYTALFMLVIWGVVEALASRRFGILTFGLLGLAVSAMYVTRISAIYLIPSVPFLFIMGNLIVFRERWGKLITGSLVFLAVCSATVLFSSMRLSKHNGYFSLSPQIAGNATVGQFMGNRDIDIFRLHPEKMTTNRRVKQRNNEGLAYRWKQNPVSEAKLFLFNVGKNFSKITQLLFNDSKSVTAAGTLCFVAMLLVMLIKVRRVRTLFKDEFWKRKSTLFLVTAGYFLLVHITAYSLLLYGQRYMAQALPIMTCFFVGVFFIVLKDVFKFHVRFEIEKEDSSWTIFRWNPQMSLMVAAFVPFTALVWSSTAVKSHSWTNLPLEDIRGLIDLREQGEKVKALAGEKKPRVVNVEWSVAFYSDGYGYPTPFTEENPELLLKYFNHHEIDFVSCNKNTGFGDLHFGVPMCHLLYFLSDGEETGVQQIEKYSLFSIDRSISQGFTEITDTPEALASELPKKVLALASVIDNSAKPKQKLEKFWQENGIKVVRESEPFPFIDTGKGKTFYSYMELELSPDQLPSLASSDAISMRIFAGRQ